MRRSICYIISAFLLITLLSLGSFTLSAEAAESTVAAGDATGGLRYTVSIAKFENRAGWTGRFNIGDAWGAVLTDLLNRSGKFIVLGETDMRQAAMNEQDLAASGRTTQGAITPGQGNMTPAQILIKGVITHVQDTSSNSGGIAIHGIVLGGSKSTSEVNVTMYMVHSSTGQVLASTSVVGTSKSSSTLIGAYGRSGGGVLNNKKHGNMGKAITNAVDQGVQWMITQLPNVTWRGNVVLIKDNNIYINRGTREGVKPDMEFIVGTASALRDPNTGEVLDVSFSEVARLRVVTVKEKIAICELAGGDAEAIETGMFVQLPQ